MQQLPNHCAEWQTFQHVRARLYPEAEMKNQYRTATCTPTPRDREMYPEWTAEVGKNISSKSHQRADIDPISSGTTLGATTYTYRA